jgi:hypothetical protein
VLDFGLPASVVTRRPAAPGFAVLAIAVKNRVTASLPQPAMCRGRLWVAELQQLGNNVDSRTGFAQV